MDGIFLLLCCSWAVQLWSFVQAYENLALKKPTGQNTTYIVSYPNCDNGCGPDRAVDGRASDLSWDGGQCALSGYSRAAEWRVDLGGVLSIHHIFIQYMTGKIAWDEDNPFTKYFLGFSVYVSNTTNKDDGVLCFRDITYTKATIPNPVNITCRHHGRYVIYYNNRTHSPYPDGYSSYAGAYLCEVEVYGCPTLTRYGENCSIPCPQNCQGGHCDIVEGTCLGCVPGYKGSRCYEVCDEHTYGLDCRESCGNCSNGTQCHHVTGACSNGCDTGVYGEKCGMECLEGTYGYNCVENCSMHCGVPGRCDKTGLCYGGCQVGWTGHLCEIKLEQVINKSNNERQGWIKRKESDFIFKVYRHMDSTVTLVPFPPVKRKNRSWMLFYCDDNGNDDNGISGVQHQMLSFAPVMA